MDRLDMDSKLIVSYLLGGRDAGYAYEFMQDVAGRIAQSGAAHNGRLEVLPGSRGKRVRRRC